MTCQTSADGIVEVEGAAGDLIAGAANDDRGIIPRASADRHPDLAMRGIETCLVSPFQGDVAGDEGAGFEDADLVGEYVNVENAPARGIRHAVEIAADAHHALVGDAALELEYRPIGGKRQ